MKKNTREELKNIRLQEILARYPGSNVNASKNNVIVLGSTGIGKSTIINYLLGAPFESDGYNLHTKAKNIKAKISEDDYESETLYSKKYYGLENTYIDTAGLMDSRGEAERIWINYDIGTLIQSLNKIKAILILFNLADIKTSRAVSFKELTKIISLSIPNLERFKNNILFIHNKEFGGLSSRKIRDGVLDGSRALKKHYEKKLKKMQQENVSEAGENLVDQIKLLDILINSTKNDRLIVTNLVGDQTRKEIKARIKNLSNLNKVALKIKNGFDDGEFYEAVEKFIAPLVLLIENKFKAFEALDKKLIDKIAVFNQMLDQKIDSGHIRNIDLVHGLYKILLSKKNGSKNNKLKMKHNSKSTEEVFITFFNSYNKIQELVNKKFLNNLMNDKGDKKLIKKITNKKIKTIRLQEIIANYPRFSEKESKNNIILMGNSGSGKSTIINYLLGTPVKILKAKKNDNDLKLYAIKKIDKNKTYIDMPGFVGAHEEIEKDWITYHIGTFVQNLSSIKSILILFNYEDLFDRHRSFKKLIEEMSLALPDINYFKRNILFIHSKGRGILSDKRLQRFILEQAIKLKKVL